ncbi:MAG: ABC transporter permease [Pseudomonadota bacterium]
MNDKIYLVAQREWLENVRTKAFWIGLLIMPVILVAAMVLPTLLSKTKDARAYAVIDNSGWLDEAVQTRAFASDLAIMLDRLGFDGKPWPEGLDELAALRTEFVDQPDRGDFARQSTGVDPAPSEPRLGAAQDLAESIRRWWDSLEPDTARDLDRRLSKAQFRQVPASVESRETLNEKLGDDQIFAYIAIEADPASSDDPASYVSKNLTDNDLENWYRRHATAAIRDRRMELRDVDPELATYLQGEFRLDRSKLSDSGTAESVSMNDRLRQWAPVGFVYLLWLSVFTVSQMLLSNTIEEKSNRLMEVLLSSISPLQLMLGKILGIAATGITMVGTWVICLIGAIIVLPIIFSGGAVGVDFSFLLSEPRYLISFLVYFVLGYLLYAAILVAIGSVCNTIKEAQNLQSPLVIVLMIPLLLMIPIGQDPNGTMAVVLSYFPPTTPFVMMNRAAGDIAWWEYAITTLLLVASVFFATVAAAKIFRIGVLMTGKPPNIREMIRWVRAPVGLIPERREPAEASDGGGQS